MLPAVAADARILNTARIIVEVLTDLLSAKTRLFIRRSVAALFSTVVEFVDVWYNGVIPVPFNALAIINLAALAIVADFVVPQFVYQYDCRQRAVALPCDVVKS
jgi:hypothetical protein